MDGKIEQLATDLDAADEAVVFTGAGVSTASGIPDFRSEGGLWDEYDPGQFNAAAFERDPAAFWEVMFEIYDRVFADDPEPNAAHDALANLEASGYLSGVITQNADRLHQAAGSEEVIELHGSLEEAVCRSCKRREPLSALRERVETGTLPPRCEKCDGLLESDAVLFGEQLPEHALFQAHSLAERADVFLVAGSSLTVEPAATLPETATKRGGTLGVVNLDPTPHDGIAEYVFRADVTEVLPRITEALE